MRQAIVTKYLGPTNKRGSRIKASDDCGDTFVEYDPRLNVEANHTEAARVVMHKRGWDKYNDMVGGHLPDGRYCFVQIERKK